jgi:hypothetical protein
MLSLVAIKNHRSNHRLFGEAAWPVVVVVVAAVTEVEGEDSREAVEEEEIQRWVEA